MYDPETKKQSVCWKTPSSPKAKKKQWGNIVFFNIQGTGMAKWVPHGETVNQQCYQQVSEKLNEHVEKKHPELWENGGSCTKTMFLPTKIMCIIIEIIFGQ